MVGALEEAGFRVYKPSGAYYIMTDVGRFGYPDDISFAIHLVEHRGVATVPGERLLQPQGTGQHKGALLFPEEDGDPGCGCRETQGCLTTGIRVIM